MKRALWLIVAVLQVPAAAQRPPELRVIDEVIVALGGRNKLDAVNTLTMTGTGTNGLLGQNPTPDAALPIFEVTSFSRTVDFTRGRARHEQSRTARFPYVFAPTQRQILGLDGTVAFNTSPDGLSTRQASGVARDRRSEYLVHHPLGIVRLATSPGVTLSHYRKTKDTEALDITTADGDRATLVVDASTHSPRMVRSMSDDATLGDVTVATAFSDYRSVDGVALPTRLTTTTDRYITADLRIAGNEINGAGGDLAAPEPVKSSPGPSRSLPHVTVQELETGIWLLAGEAHHSVLVEFSDHTELIEVPASEARAIAVIEQARKVVPNKPLRKVIVTHHHFDHTAGVRAAVAAGLALVTHRSNKSFLEDLVRRPHTIVPDRLAGNPAPLRIETVGDRMLVNDLLTTMEVYHVEGDQHSDTSLMVYFPKGRLLVQADLFSTHFATQPSAPSLLENIAKRKLDVARHVPLHGEIRTHDEFPKYVQPARTAN